MTPVINMLSKNGNMKNCDYNSHVFSEICKGELGSIKLLQKNPDFHWSNVTISSTKETILHIAAQYGHIEIINYLLNQFSPKMVDVRNTDNKTPLHSAAQFGNFACVRKLVQSGADINALKRSDWTPVMLACTKPEHNYKEIVEYLCEKGAILNFKNKDGWTCLHLASRNANPSILRVLCERNIDFKSVTNNGRTALHISALHGNLEHTELLVSKIDINSEDSSGNTPFHEAVLGGNIDLIDFLVDKGADILAKNKNGSSALHLAAGNGSENILLHLVKKYKLDLNEVNLSGHTSLHCAARKRHTKIFELLVELGADSKILDRSGRLAEEYLL
ncbi:ankyrin repeat domain-containing protein 16-like [Coccinella septempunctata]|uniref:ankyrin repeat domain-containing protein 16-like n=1 Tax=Coccinella septempunctata TaxID=41139 RepID=UPI001D06B166|nr:ankyrin repeat domain-containing protein 16-like [Coccinella septempunctata]